MLAASERGIKQLAHSAETEYRHRFPAGCHVMGLHVKDELVLGPLFSGSSQLKQLVRINLEEFPEDRVESHERGGHSTRAQEKLSPRDAELFGTAVSKLGQAGLDFLLFGSLRDWIELLIGNNLCRQ